ncbi:hypothetical protein RCG23_13855 [Neobacillus sp. PS3-34]|uniref:hypothetical protein n=1 Tax=Neobacillus sp. PS3-34 TaxID=3070678 RepID=UPI0027DFC772|nr:hypothetical protein [Neobacillus sp. PS3-34]WML46728.1 hypothetical protein RCG23_13855 [Neobacillus sp. PS3-34]
MAALNKVQVLTKSGWAAVTTKNLPATELYGVGGGYYVLKSNTVKYMTPTKQKLAELQKAKQVAWGKTLLKRGQIGKITVLTNTPLYKISSNGADLIPQPRTLKKGEELRIYTYKKGA